MNNPFEELSSQIEELKSLLLIKLTKPELDSQIGNDFLTIEEAGELLKLAVPTIYGLVNKRVIPYMKKGKRLFFSKKELTEWVKSGRRKTAAEITEEAEKNISEKRKTGGRR
jgi:excisionase family DNA binding protein